MRQRKRLGARCNLVGAGAALILLLGSSAGASTIQTLLHPFTGDDAEVRITLDDTSAGAGRIEVTVEVTQSIADIRGVFFNLANDALLEGLTVTGQNVTSYGVGDVRKQGHGDNLNGGGSPCPCDLGIEIGRPGMGKDDIWSTTFVISHPDGIGLDAFLGQEVGVRLTSVGRDREGSSKLSGVVVPEPTTASLLALGLLGLALRRRAASGCPVY